MYNNDASSSVDLLTADAVRVFVEKLGEGVVPLFISAEPSEAQGTSDRPGAPKITAVLECREGDCQSAEPKNRARLVLFCGELSALELSAVAVIHQPPLSWDFGLTDVRGPLQLVPEDFLFVSVTARGKPSSAKWQDPKLTLLWQAVEKLVRGRGFCAFCVLPSLSDNPHFKWTGSGDCFQCEIPEGEFIVPRIVAPTHSGPFDPELIDLSRLLRSVAPGSYAARKIEGETAKLVVNLFDPNDRGKIPTRFDGLDVEIKEGVSQEEFEKYVHDSPVILQAT